MIVLDTDVLSEPMRQRPDARVLAWLTGLEEESAVTAVTAVEATLGTFAGSVLAYDDAAARAASRGSDWNWSTPGGDGGTLTSPDHPV